MNFNDRVILNELKLNDTDDQIIDYIRKNMDDFLNQSIQQTAENLYTVPNTIVRLSKKLGYKGFSELKFEIRKETEENEEKIHIEQENLLSENIIKTINIIDMGIIKKAVKKIEKARRIYILGIGDSIYFCEMFAKNLRCINKDAEIFRHRHDMMYCIQKSSEKDLYIIISVSGNTSELVEACMEIKKKGSEIISMTSLCENNVAKLSDLNLFFWAPIQMMDNYNITDRIGIMILIRIISELLWEK